MEFQLKITYKLMVCNNLIFSFYLSARSWDLVFSLVFYFISSSKTIQEKWSAKFLTCGGVNACVDSAIFCVTSRVKKREYNSHGQLIG